MQKNLGRQNRSPPRRCQRASRCVSFMPWPGAQGIVYLFHHSKGCHRTYRRHKSTRFDCSAYHRILVRCHITDGKTCRERLRLVSRFHRLFVRSICFSEFTKQVLELIHGGVSPGNVFCCSRKWTRTARKTFLKEIKFNETYNCSIHPHICLKEAVS